MKDLTWPAVLAVLLMPATVAAQDRPAARAEARPPSDPGAATAPLVHRSALSSYRRSGGEDPPATAWREANDTVGRIGGWRAYAREAQAGADAVPPAPPAPTRPPAAVAPAPGSVAPPAAPARPAGHAHHAAPATPASAPRR